jgi:lysozyme family protein
MLLRFEGGFVNNPNDPGGMTNKGITLRTFQLCAHELLGVDPSPDNLRNLTDGQAGIIYKANYWNKMQGDRFPSQDLANIVCDFFVNAGTNATKLLQQVLNGLGADLVEDGVIGAGSIQALNTCPLDRVYPRYKQARTAYYRNLAATSPGLAAFLAGWLNRVNSFPDSPSTP